jgi:hypothetical protein
MSDDETLFRVVSGTIRTVGIAIDRMTDDQRHELLLQLREVAAQAEHDGENGDERPDAELAETKSERRIMTWRSRCARSTACSGA